MAESKSSDESQPSSPVEDSLTDLPAWAEDGMLGEFRLLRKLGTGGMAQVFLAEQTTLRRQVAVKILRPEFLTEENYVKRFRHEAAAAGSLNHPNIVQVYMVGEHKGVNYIAQEYVHGRTLKSYLKQKGPVELKIAMHILRQVASALQAAGQSGIVHRDIKPENILLTNKGEAKVADFGLAQLTHQGERISLTQTGMTMGTPLYMSPEQINGQPLDARSDIYSFGIMAWHMLTGRPPFSGETAMTVALKHLNEKPPEISSFREDLPVPLRDFVLRMMQKKKEDRPANFAAVSTELKQIIRQLTGKDDATVVLNQPRKKTAFLDKPFRQQIVWILLACILVMAASAGVGWTMRTPELKTIPSTARSPVQSMPNAKAAFYYAVTNPQDEAAWVTVKELPDATDAQKNRAATALGLIYLKTNRKDLAESTFASLKDSVRTRADGQVGMALVSHSKGDLTEARRLMAQIDDSSSSLSPEIIDAYKDLRQRLNIAK